MVTLVTMMTTLHGHTQQKASSFLSALSGVSRLLSPCQCVWMLLYDGTEDKLWLHEPFLFHKFFNYKYW